MNDPLGPPETRIVLLERLHDQHIQCACLCTRLGRQRDARVHFDACREIVKSLVEIDRMSIHLPDDVARCSGVGSDDEGWREGCDICARRLASWNGDRVVIMEPPPIIVFECEFLIDAPRRHRLVLPR